MVSTIGALNADDIVFLVGPIGLWSHGEITAGFLILCVPCVPKAFKGSFVVRIFSSLSRGKEDQTNSRRGLPSWYRKGAVERVGDGMSEAGSHHSVLKSVRVDARSVVSDTKEHERKWSRDTLHDC